MADNVTQMQVRKFRRHRAVYASRPEDTRGRLYEEEDCPTRSPFQRDRDRVIHSSAFRRLTYKTQVFIYHEGDHYRTRLTHSLEVAQIARSIARILALDEDLAEALALAHDLGHPPFGHAGERALDVVMSGWGGFDHNAQSLRIVSALEKKYASFDGLNLSWETLEGLVKHNGPLVDFDGAPTEQYAEKGVPEAITAYSEQHDLMLATFASAEAQIAALADDIAYNNHDIDDGLRAGLIKRDQLRGVALPARMMDEIDQRYSDLPESRYTYELNRRMITVMVNDVADESERRLAAHSPASADDIRNAGKPLISFCEAMTEDINGLRAFLRTNVYRHPKISNVMEGAEEIVRDLFLHLMENIDALPEEWRALVANGDEVERARHICDFVAGFTDRFAIREHQRLFDETPDLR